MLKKQYRLKNKYAFTATYHVKNSYHQGGITLFCGKIKKDNQPTKVGFVVSKKTHKRAVKRNRIKRLTRESYRILQKENTLFNSQKFMSLIFICHSAALGKNYNDIKTIVTNLLKRVK